MFAWSEKKFTDFCSQCRGQRRCLLAVHHLSEPAARGIFCTRRAYPEGVVLLAEGDAPGAIHLLCAGKVKLCATSRNGRVVTFDSAVPGDLLGLRAVLTEQPSDLTAITSCRSVVCSLPREEFLRTVHADKGMILKIAQYLSEELSRAYDDRREASFLPLYHRLVRLLAHLLQAQGESSPDVAGARLEITQEELAEMLGTTRRTVTRALRKLKDRKVIECRHGAIVICDRASLLKEADSETLF